MLDPNALELPEELRKRERVERYKQETGQSAGMARDLVDPSLSDPMKERTLSEL